MITGGRRVREPAPRRTAGGTSADGPDRPPAWRPSKRAHIISGVAVFVVFLGHLVTSWPWITAVLRRGARPRGRPRTNRTLDVLLFVVMVTALYSGFVISVDLLPSLGLDVAPHDFWVSVHSASATLIVPLVAAHLALHWRWMRRNVLRRRSTAGAPA